jgi:pimeloyl-ACP methyl ester carboxylesterase
MYGAGIEIDEGATPTLPMPRVAGVEHRFLEARGATFHIAHAGDGPPLVLLHGWPQHWWCWREVIGPLAERYLVLCPDIRGLGWSGGANGSFRWDELAEDLIAQLDAFGLDRVRLVGFDWGCVIGYRACLMYPARFERFVPMTAVHMWQGLSTPPIGFKRPWHLWTVAALGAAAITRLGIADRALRVWRCAGEFSEDETAVYMGALRRPSSIEATVSFDREFVFYELPRGLRRFRRWYMKVPTLHLYGQHDPLTPAVPDSYRRYTRDMRIATVAGSGHFIPEEAPDKLLEHLDAFL